MSDAADASKTLDLSDLDDHILTIIDDKGEKHSIDPMKLKTLDPNNASAEDLEESLAIYGDWVRDLSASKQTAIYGRCMKEVVALQDELKKKGVVLQTSQLSTEQT